MAAVSQSRVRVKKNKAMIASGEDVTELATDIFSVRKQVDIKILG